MRRLIPYYDEQREVICRIIPFESHRTFGVLDLGCGPGLLARRILAEYSHATLTALDVTDDMLEACRARLGATDRVTYCLGDFRTTELAVDILRP